MGNDMFDGGGCCEFWYNIFDIVSVELFIGYIFVVCVVFVFNNQYIQFCFCYYICSDCFCYVCVYYNSVKFII